MTKGCAVRGFPLRPRKPWLGYRWYSICSRHRDYRWQCPHCNGGGWFFEPFGHTLTFNGLLWKLSPRLWRKWANR